MRHLSLLALALLLLQTHVTLAQQYSWTNSDDKTAFLGINSEQLPVEKAKLLGFNNHYGSYVTSVVPNSVAEKAGLQPFDYIYGIDNFRTNEDRNLTSIIRKYQAGDKGTLHLIRKNKSVSVDIVFGKRSDAERGGEVEKKEEAFLGVSPHEDESSEEPGVKITVVRKSTAEKMGLKDGDVITSLNGYSLIDWQDLSMAIKTVKVGDTFVIEYQRDGKTAKAEQKAEARQEEERTFEIVTDGWDWSDKSESGNSAFLGINSTTISAEKAKYLGYDNPYGSYITKVIDNTAAAKAGLQPFDYVVGINDFRVDKDQNLTDILKRFKNGDEATVYFIRNGKAQSARVTFVKRSTTFEFEWDMDDCKKPFFGISQSHQPDDRQGVAVTIIDNSTAKAMGMQDGDLITGINGHPIYDWEDITIAINTLKVGDNIEVNYLRKGEKIAGKQAIKSYCDTKKEGEWNWGGFELRKNENEDETDNAAGSERVNVNDVNVALLDMPEDEAAQFKQRYGVDMAVNNNLVVENLQLIPNASMGMFRLQFRLPGGGETSIRVYNGAGRLIYDYDLGVYNGDFSDEIDISQNGAGNYYLDIRQGDKRLSKKILLQSK